MIHRTPSIALAILLTSCANGSDESLGLDPAISGPLNAAELSAVVEYVRAEHDLPGLGVLIQACDEEPLTAAAGVRKLGADEAVTEADSWFIGSAAKAMTATLLATFVEEGRAAFETKLVEIFPEYEESFSDASRSINLEHLLNHAAGLQANPARSREGFARLMSGEDDPSEQRKRVLVDAVSRRLAFAPGSDTAYSNTGYILAGAVIERLGGKDFETLLAERVLEPLGITDFGFGPPGRQDPGQPWGHRPSFFGRKPVAPDDEEHVNPAVFDPAGNLNIGLEGWAAYVCDQLEGRRGEGALLEQATYERLQWPPDAASGYALGWGVLVEDNAAIMLTHNGSDGAWFADVRAYPHSNLILLSATNDGREDGAAKAAAADIRRLFQRRYSPFPPQ